MVNRHVGKRFTTLKLGFVFVLTFGFLVAALWGIDLPEVGSTLSAIHWGYLFPMWGLYLVGHTVRSWRFQLLIGEPVLLKRVFAVNSIGFLAINVVPLRLGEVVRPYLLMERDGIPMGRGLAAVAMERLLDMIMLLFLLAGMSWFEGLPEEGVVVAGVEIISTGQRLAGVAVVVGLSGILGLWFCGSRLIRFVEGLPVVGRLAPALSTFRDGLVALLVNPLRGLLLLLLSVVVWGITIAAVAVVMAAFPGVPVGLAEAWSTWTLTLAGMTAVPTPGFFGAYEAFCSAALWLWGVDGTVARTFAVVLHLGQFSFTVAMGGSFLLLEGYSLRQVVRGGLSQ